MFVRDVRDHCATCNCRCRDRLCAIQQIDASLHSLFCVTVEPMLLLSVKLTRAVLQLCQNNCMQNRSYFRASDDKFTFLIDSLKSCMHSAS